MFTGIITDIGTTRSVGGKGDTHITIATHYKVEEIGIGASIACNGICLTVVDKDKDWFAVVASQETLDKTTLSDWREGTKVNLERALKLGDELGGHMVSGHVDGVARIIAIAPRHGSRLYTLEAPDGLQGFIAPKGSVTLDGVSLTVNAVEANRFTVNLIGHTLATTALAEKTVGDNMNLEVDMLARYAARLLEKRKI